MKWWSVLVVLSIGAALALAGAWLWRRKKKIDAKTNGGASIPDPAKAATVRAIETAPKKVS